MIQNEVSGANNAHQNNKAAPGKENGFHSGFCAGKSSSGFSGKSDITEAHAQKQALSQLDNFLSAFFPDEQEPIYLRFLDCKTLDGKELPKQLKRGGQNVESSRSLIKQGGFSAQSIQGANTEQGIYFVVNAGGNSNKDITRFNAFFVESDTLTIEEQNERLNNAPLLPSIRVETNKSLHAYWLIQDGCTAQEWRKMQKRLIEYFDGDTSIKNESRLMRLPFFNHVRYDENAAKYIYKPVELKTFEPTRRYTIQEMQAAFAANQIQPNVPTALQTNIQSIEEINSAFLSDAETNPAEAQELAAMCLQHLKQERCDNRVSWRDAGYAVHNAFNGDEKGYELWREWSKKSPKYNEDDCQTIWGGCNPNHPNAVKLGTLIQWACEDSAEFRQFWNERTGKIETSEKQTQATQATRLLKSVMSRLELFHTAEGECFASVLNNGHQETHKLSSRSFKDWLSYESYRQEGKTPNAQTMTDVIQTLTGKARFDSPQTEVFLRVAEKDDAIYVDLCDETWRVVEITKDGWRVLNHSPVKFRRTKGMLALPEPLPGGNLTRLKNFINVCESDFVLVLAWLVGCFCYNKPYPVLILHGEQGSAKSTTSRTLRRLVDPNKADLREKPKENRDLMIAANNGYVVAYDNLSSLSPELSDSMCRLATGGGFSTRELYSNDEETIFDVVRPLILNGIEETVSRSDLLDRALIIECPRITEQSRKTEAECKSSFASEHGKLLGALFDAVSCAIRELPNVKLERLPRMADFAKWACAAEPAFNLPGRTFLARYESNRATAHAVTLDSSPIGKALVGFMQGKTVWQGTAEELRGLLTSGFDNGLTGFPKTAKALGGAIKRLSPTLRANGFDITSQRANNARTITITKQM